MAITTKIEIQPDSIKISSKHVQTLCYKKALKMKQPVYAGMMHPPHPQEGETRGFFSKLTPFVCHLHICIK
jgi:hypothetical protein